MDPAQAGFGQLNPTLQVNIPRAPGGSLPAGLHPGIQLARPPLPDEQQLRQCYAQSDQQDAFFECLVDRAMPREYRLTKQCLEDHADDSGRALVCSTGNQDLARSYDRFKEVSDCAKQDDNDEWDITQCIGNNTLGQNERYYMGCVTKNKGDPKTAVVCALAKDLTPEQQIALSCAMSTGGNPKAFAVCTGGRLLERELTKCWEHGIATNQGCFGPNNEYRRFLRSVDDQMRRSLGENSVAYHAYEFWQNNVLAPGPNHEVIRHINNGLNDLRNGPGPNNEAVKAGRALEGGVRSIGKVLGF
ncbi:hypothetical protein [Methylobacterium sp. Leaf85]|uniref:hypothetical protein n=1 Tax=Methylobacterium sp. Leaf85 TaxID=1736241 RepID=UPI0012E80AFB|nr:hypothetical protein [Methylobacterium sp. Leaf85]